MTKSKQKNKNKNPFRENKHEIKYNLINCGLAGGLVLLGSLANGGFTKQGLFYAVVTGLIACSVKFSNYWASQENEYSKNLFSFVGA